MLINQSDYGYVIRVNIHYCEPRARPAAAPFWASMNIQGAMLIPPTSPRIYPKKWTECTFRPFNSYHYGWAIENNHFFVAALLLGIANIGHTYQTKAVSQHCNTSSQIHWKSHFIAATQHFTFLMRIWTRVEMPIT